MYLFSNFLFQIDCFRLFFNFNNLRNSLLVVLFFFIMSPFAPYSNNCHSSVLRRAVVLLAPLKLLKINLNLSFLRFLYKKTFAVIGYLI